MMNGSINLKKLDSDDRFYVDAQINDTPCKLLFDTGCVMSRLSKNFAQRARLHLSSSQNGKCYHYPIQAGSWKTLDFDFFPEDADFTSDYNNMMNPHMDGLLGMNIIKYYPFCLDYTGKTPIAYIGNNSFSNSEELLPIERDAYSRPFLNVNIDGDIIHFLLDTGARETYLNMKKDSWRTRFVHAPYGTSNSYCKHYNMEVADNIPINFTPNISSIVSAAIDIDRVPLIGIDALRGCRLSYYGQGKYCIFKK